MTPRTLEYFFDINSPYSYLAATQLERVAGHTGALVRWRPMLLGGVFKGSGNAPPAQVPSKGAWMLTDLKRWSDFYGVPYRFPALFPLNSLRVQRVLHALAKAEGEDAIPAVAMALFRAYWAEGLNPNDDAVLTSALAGHDVAALLALSETQEIKDALRTTTEEAVARGAFGAPTFFVGESMFFGNDRFPLIEAALRA